ncbi:hypothetical protein F5Y11DRAFT_333121 [Daldinia sp. FL1419]|nr:hypothetical protein F5Y11DRAFT_333121 [Daldinia sp. FL1419]
MSEVIPAFLAPVPETSEESEDIDDTIVEIRHPGYSVEHPALLQFIQFQNQGVEYDLVYYAACIIAGNVWSDNPKPYFTRGRNCNSTPISRPVDGILRDDQYYFHVPSYASPKYPITISFCDWVFPHDNIPQIWNDLMIHRVPKRIRDTFPPLVREAIITRDISCRITKSVTVLEKAHVVPIGEKDWFMKNGMQQYIITKTNNIPIHDTSNLFALRGDIHWQFDHKHFTGIPKLVDGQYKLVGQVLQGNASCLHEQKYLFHNRAFQQLNDVRPQYLFARFAWSIFNNTTLCCIPTTLRPFSVRFRLEVKPDEESEEAQTGPPPAQLLIRTISSPIALLDLRQGLPPGSGRKRTCDELAQDDNDMDLIWSVQEGKMVHLNQIDYPFGEPDYDKPIMIDSENDSEFELDRPVKRERVEQSPSPCPSTPPLSQSIASLGSSFKSESSNQGQKEHNHLGRKGKLGKANPSHVAVRFKEV